MSQKNLRGAVGRGVCRIGVDKEADKNCDEGNGYQAGRSSVAALIDRMIMEVGSC